MLFFLLDVVRNGPGGFISKVVGIGSSECQAKCPKQRSQDHCDALSADLRALDVRHMDQLFGVSAKELTGFQNAADVAVWTSKLHFMWQFET